MNGRPDAPPIIVTRNIRNAVQIIAHEDDARWRGIHFGQSLSDARALVPELDCFGDDPDAVQALLCHIAAWCERYTPLVAISGEDSLFMDITGCAHLFGGEQALLDDLGARLTALGFHALLCIADNPGAAWAMAHYGSERLIHRGDHKSTIAHLPMAALRLGPDTVTALGRIGLKTIGCIATLPRGPLAQRFGPGLLCRLDQAMGREGEAISPRSPVAELTSDRHFIDPVVHEDDIKRTIGVLAQNIIPLLERRGLGARTCRVRLFRVDGEVSALSVHTASPLRDARQIERLFHERLAGLHEELDAGFGFDIIRLDILRADKFDAVQKNLVTPEHRDGMEYEALVNRLCARLGTDRVRQFSHADTHIPERSFATVPVARGPAQSAPAPRPETPHATPSRPLILLQMPEPVETLAEVPEGPPIRFRWRKVFYETARTEGPERIACEWWRDGRTAQTRDYFRVEDRQGYRFWMFRFGLYGRETASPKWYMHGLFP